MDKQLYDTFLTIYTKCQKAHNFNKEPFNTNYQIKYIELNNTIHQNEVNTLLTILKNKRKEFELHCKYFNHTQEQIAAKQAVFTMIENTILKNCNKNT